MKVHDDRNAFEVYIKNIPRAELGGLLKQYIAESNHCGWDGFDSRDITGIKRFLADMVLYHKNYLGDTRGLATKITNVNPVP